MHAQLLSCVLLFATSWTVAHQVPLCVEFSWQEYGSGLPRPPPGIFSSQDQTRVSCIAGGLYG